MNTTISKDTLSVGARAKDEIQLQSNDPHEFRLNLTGCIDLDNTFQSLMENDIIHTGVVNLERLVVNYMFTGERQHIYMGVCSVSGSKSAEYYGMLEDGLAATSSPLNVGVHASINLIPRSFLSRRIQVSSSEAPMLKIKSSITSGVKVNLVIHFSLAGPLIIDREWKKTGKTPSDPSERE